MRLWSRPGTQGAGGEVDDPVCVHCEEAISPCRGQADLPPWSQDPKFRDCRFGRYIHVSGERPGSHVCRDGQLATPAPGSTQTGGAR